MSKISAAGGFGYQPPPQQQMPYPAFSAIPEGSPGQGGAPLYPSLHSYQEPNMPPCPYPPNQSAGGFVTGEACPRLRDSESRNLGPTFFYHPWIFGDLHGTHTLLCLRACGDHWRRSRRLELVMMPQSRLDYRLMLFHIYQIKRNIKKNK